jgi:hypothetical protein
MKIPVIKLTASQYSIKELDAAEEAILNEEKPAIHIEGEDEGEQLTHIMAAREIRGQMEKEGIDLNRALRNYTLRVRNSIS